MTVVRSNGPVDGPAAGEPASDTAAVAADDNSDVRHPDGDTSPSSAIPSGASDGPDIPNLATRPGRTDIAGGTGLWARLGMLAAGASAGLAATSALVLQSGAAGWAPAAAGGATIGALLAGISLRHVFSRLRTVQNGAELVAGSVDQSDAAHLITDRAGRVVHANRAVASVLRMDRPADVPALLAALRLDRADEDGRAAVQRAAAAPVPLLEAEVRYPAGAGEERRILSVTIRPVDARPDHALWRIEDVTARREMEAVLREEQAKLDDFLDLAPVGFYSVDGDGRFIFVNETLAAWLGMRPSDLMRGDRRLHEFLAVPPLGAPPYALAEDPSREVVEVLLRGAGGRYLNASIAQALVRDRTGVWTRSVVRDLTQERRMRAALEASEARFRRFFEDAPIGLALVDGACRMTQANAAFRTLIVQAAGEEALSRRDLSVLDLVVPEDRARLQAQLQALSGPDAAESAPPMEIRMARGPITVAVFPKRFEDPHDRQMGLILQVIDLTEQKQLEMQFAQSQKMRAVGQLAGGIAHDFNNLLTAMIGYCDLLLVRHAPGDPSFGDIMQIKQNANRAANLVRQLLAFSRQQTLTPRVLNVTDVLGELSHLLRRLLGASVELRMLHGRDLGLIKVDQGQLEQVIINLAVNSRDAMPTGGRLTIATSRVREGAGPTAGAVVPTGSGRGGDAVPAGDFVAIEIFDTGHGIPADILDRIFDPFFSTKAVGEGTGLGLSTVYGIVHQTGGYVTVDSEPGSGAKFTIYLPCHGAEPAGATASPSGAAEDAPRRDLTGRGRILIVEDEDAVRAFSVRTLRTKGYDVLEASDGQEALEILDEDGGAVDLLITDIVMPGMDGPALVRAVRERMPQVRVICISGYAEDRFQQQMDDIDEAHFLAKPFSLKDLAEAVKDVMAGGAPAHRTFA